MDQLSLKNLYPFNQLNATNRAIYHLLYITVKTHIMKKFISLLMTLSILVSCSDDENNPAENPELISKWKHIETLIDPGDGSGTFQPVESDLTMEFYSDSTVTTNEPLCSNSVLSESGTYSSKESN